MSEKCKCGCCFTWLSGFFAMPAIAHIVRILLKWDLVVNGQPFEMKTSWIVVIACGILAFIFGIVACKKHKSEGSQTSSCCQ